MKALLLAATVLSLLATGCVTPQRAVSAASVRSKCDAKNIKVLDSDGTSAVLDVCGETQQWVWHPVAGYEYAAKVAPRTAGR